MDQTQKKKEDKKCLIGMGEKPDKLRTIFQHPFSLKVDALYLHMQVVSPRSMPHNLELIIPIAVAAFLVNIGIGRAKYPTNNYIMRAVQNTTPSDNIIKQILRRAQQHCYKDVAKKLYLGFPSVLSFDKCNR